MVIYVLLIVDHRERFCTPSKFLMYEKGFSMNLTYSQSHKLNKI